MCPIRALHDPLNTALRKSRQTIDELQLYTIPIEERRIALGQIREWLQEASESGDHALMALEKMVVQNKRRQTARMDI
jgi:hypothetical protein